MHLIEHGKVLSALRHSKLLLKMKLTALLVMLLCMQVSAKTFSQRISVNAKDITLEKFLHLIEVQSGYGIVYPEEIIEKTKLVSVQVQDKPLDEVLNATLKPQGLTWVVKNNTIIIRRAKAAANVAEQLQQQTMAMQAAAEKYEISGVVTDAGGAPLSGASVQIKGLSKGTVTNERGAFSIKGVNAGSYKILVSLIGYAPFEKPVTVNQDQVVNVSLQTAVNQLDETVIIAYGSTSKRLNTGAVSSLGTDAIAKQTISNPLTALQGRVAGVQVTQDNGLAGGGVRLQIRGQGTAGAGYIPLYVIDGVPFTLFNGGTPASDGLNAYGISGANGSVSPFSMINPDDIERIDVLKDADATAIYGSRGANGVVLITTKKGSKGKTAVNVNFYQGIGKVNHFIDMMDTKEYLAMRREGFAKSGTVPTATNAKDLLVWDTTAYTDWQRWALGGTADYTHANIGISGGNEHNSFLFNTTYSREGTVYPGSFHSNNYAARLSAGHSSADNKFNIQFTSSYSYMGNNLPGADLSGLYSLAPNLPMYNTNGSVNFDVTLPPLANLMKKYNANTNNFIANANISYKLLSSLVLRANLGYTNTRIKQAIATPARYTNSTATTANQLQYADNTNDNYIIEPQAEFTPKLGLGKLQLLAGSTFQQTKSTGVSLLGVGFLNESVINNIGSAATVTVQSSNNSLYKYTGFFGRANYNIYNKYLLNATFRRDASSRFGPGNRFGTFGAVGAAWIFTEEDFMKNLKFISFGKLRAGYGVTGNDQIPNYQYMDTYTAASSYYNYVGSSVLIPGNIDNPNLHWETNKKLDIALELGFLKDRILFKTNYYRNRSSDLLVNVPLAGQSGSTSYTGNLPAVVQNKGVEFELAVTPVNTKRVKWDVVFNMSINENKLLAFPGLASSSYATSYKIGYPITLLQLYQYTGPDAATGTPTFADLNKDGSVTLANDRLPAYVGTPYYGGVSSSVSWNNFTVDVAFQFNHRYGYKNSTLIMNSSPYGYGYTNHTTAVLNRWHKAGDSGKDLLSGANTNYVGTYYNYATSDANWGDASFIKFKTLSITYALPGNTLKKAGFNAASVFVRGQNLFVWAKQKYTYDPETTMPGTGAGLGVGTYIAFPQLRVITAGFNLSF